MSNFDMKKTMKEKGVRQVDVCNALGVDKATVSGWCSGRRRIGLDYLVPLADFLDITTDEILGRGHIDEESIDYTRGFANGIKRAKTLSDLALDKLLETI